MFFELFVRLWTHWYWIVPALNGLGRNSRLEVIMASFRLDLGSAAVNEQFDTRDETGVIRRQKQRRLGNFLGFPHASHRDGGHNPCNHVCRLPTHQRRIDRTRTNNVRADTTVLQICSPGSHQRADCSLTRGVDAEGGSALNTRDGAVENDRATILQERQCLLHRKQRSPYIDVEQLVEMLFGDGPEGNKFANAGVGENNIDSPLPFRHGLVETIKVGQIGNVSLNARDIAADCFYGLVEFLLVTARDEDIRTLLDE